jgi:hypothetical protein
VSDKIGFKIRNEKDLCKNEPVINFKTANTDSGERNQYGMESKSESNVQPYRLIAHPWPPSRQMPVLLFLAFSPFLHLQLP